MHDSVSDIWGAAASSMFAGAVRHLTEDGAGIDIPGEVGPYGRGIDRLEGFARVGLLAAFLHRSQIPVSSEGALEFLLRGVSVGAAPGRGQWPKTGPRARPQVLVEAASVALALRVVGPDAWQLVSAETRRSVLEWFEGALLIPIPDNNWHLFRMILAGTIEAFGTRTTRTREVRDSALTRLQTWLGPRSWYSDGPGRSYDYYNSFALHYYPTLDAYLGERECLATYVSRLEEFTGSFMDWFSDRGSPVIFGRSLTYRFGVAASLALCGVLTKDEDLAMRAGSTATACVQYFLSSGVLKTGTLTLGWLGPDRSLIQGYSGPASPYWASKAFVALLTPRLSSWDPQSILALGTVPASSLGPPGVLAHRPSREIVTIYNHGSVDRSLRADPFRLESPLYSRIGYSSVAPPAAADDGFIPMGVAVSGSKRTAARGSVIVSSEGNGWVASTSSVRVSRRARSEFRRGRGLPYGRRAWSFAPASLRPAREANSARLAIASVAVEDWVVHAIDVRASPISGALRFVGWPIDASALIAQKSTREVYISGVETVSDLVSLCSAHVTVVTKNGQALPMVQTDVVRGGNGRLLVATRIGTPGSTSDSKPVARETAEGFEIVNGSSFQWNPAQGRWTEMTRDLPRFGILPRENADSEEV